MATTTTSPRRQTLEMDLVLAARACLAQLPALARRRLKGYCPDIQRLQARALADASAQRLGRNLFGRLANASVHCGGADTLRPLFAELSRVRVYLMLCRQLVVEAPEPLVRGTPGLVAHLGCEQLWVDTHPRDAEVLAGFDAPRVLVLDRSTTLRRRPPLLLGRGYAGEFHLLAAHAGQAGSGTTSIQLQQCAGVDPSAVALISRFASACLAVSAPSIAAGHSAGQHA